MGAKMGCFDEFPYGVDVRWVNCRGYWRRLVANAGGPLAIETQREKTVYLDCKSV